MNVTSEHVERLREALRWNASVTSPIMERHRAMIAREAQGARAIRLLPVYRIIAIMGWLAFLAAVIVAGMR